MSRPMGDLLREYDELSKSIKGMEDAKKACREQIMAAMRERGDSVEVIEAGGYRASIHYRSYLGFNDEAPDGGPLDPQVVAVRLQGLHDFFRLWAPTKDIPASDKIQAAWTAFLAAKGLEDAPLPEFLRKSDTPTLRVSGAGTTN